MRREEEDNCTDLIQLIGPLIQNVPNRLDRLRQNLNPQILSLKSIIQEHINTTFQLLCHPLPEKDKRVRSGEIRDDGYIENKERRRCVCLKGPGRVREIITIRAKRRREKDFNTATTNNLGLGISEPKNTLIYNGAGKICLIYFDIK